MDEKAKHSQLNKTYVNDNNRKENEFKVDQFSKINKTYIVNIKEKTVGLEKKKSNNKTDKLVTVEDSLDAVTEEDKQP